MRSGTEPPSRYGRDVGVEDNKAAVNRLIDDGINKWDPSVFDEVFTTAAVERAHRDFGSFKRGFSDWEMDIQELVADGDVVVARFKCRGTHSGIWLGHAPSGKQMEVDEVFFFRFRDGLIDEVWALEDTRTRGRQLGF
jgi:predicted ester cyclase